MAERLRLLRVISCTGCDVYVIEYSFLPWDRAS